MCEEVYIFVPKRPPAIKAMAPSPMLDREETANMKE